MFPKIFIFFFVFSHYFYRSVKKKSCYLCLYIFLLFLYLHILEKLSSFTIFFSFTFYLQFSTDQYIWKRNSIAGYVNFPIFPKQYFVSFSIVPIHMREKVISWNTTFILSAKVWLLYVSVPCWLKWKTLHNFVKGSF